MLIRVLLLALALLIAPAVAAGLLAQDRGIDWLVLVVDRSDSIDPDEYRLQRDAYIQVLPQPQVAEQVRQVAIVEFGTRAEVVVEWTDPEAASAAYAQRGRGSSWGYGGGYNLTAIGRGIQAAIGLLDGKTGRRVIDVSGDGRDNVDFALLRRMQEYAAWNGIEVNGLVIEGQGGLEAYYRERVVTGFVMVATGWEDFQRALIAKLSMEIAGPPYGETRLAEVGQ